MKRKRIGKVIAASLIVVLVAAIFGILKISSIDKYKGLVKVKNATLASISTKLSANISELSEDNNIEVKGYDEIDYNISYKLSDYTGERDVIINAKLDDNDKYASFKEVTGTNITSVLSSNRKEITITLKNLPSNETINSKVTMVITNAPKGYTVSPIVKIKESTGEDYTNIQVKAVTVNTNSVVGTVIDEDGNKVSNILIALKKNNEIIKETYTNDEGVYTLSDITPDTYSVVVNEENYEDLELNNLFIQDGNMLNLIVKRVYPYKIETNKYITKVELNNLGSKKDYLYNDVVLANIPVKKVNNLHGKIYYKITVQNTGEKAGIISSVKDELPEGLSFDENLNSGYELKNGIIYNRNLEGIELSAGEQISDTLVLTIENTDIAKTYINKVNARGELYEHVVYLLNGRTYKTLDVLEGELIDEPTVNEANFSGWYTDEKLTNKYNFSLPVEKDLILYGVTTRNHTVKFIDKDPENPSDPNPLVYDEKEVPNGDPVDKPRPDPEHEGYDFCGWTKDDIEWDFNSPVTEDLTLISKYCIKSYNVEFYDKSASNGVTYNLIDSISKEYKSTLSNSETPDLSNAWAGHNFLKWTTDIEGNNEYDFASLIKNNIKLYAQYSLQDRSFIFNDENRITEKTVEYGAYVQPIADQGKEGHTFLFWSLTVPSSSETKEPFDFANTQMFTTTTVYAIYQINSYDIIYNDLDPWTNTTSEYTRETVNHGSNATKPSVDPTKEGHTFDGWYKDDAPYDFNTPVTGPITLTSHYTKNKVNVRFMDGDDLWENKQIDYADTVTAPATNPTKEHKIFLYWSENNQTEFDYSTQIKEDKTLYSVYEDVVPPVISHSPLYWTNDKVLVTITGTNPNYTYVYKVDDGTYQNYTEPFELETNSNIVAKSVYGDAESTLTSHQVTNIDKLSPVIGTLTTTPSFNSIVIAGTINDNQSGVQTITIYNGNTAVGVVNGTPVNAELKDYTKDKDLNFVVSGLTQNTEYTFRIVVVDGAGNVSETSVNETTTQPEIICRIISVDGVDLPEEDYIEFPLLASAIADTHCDSKCTIQMLKNTNESVSILNTQDITLDLNGKTVAGVLPGYTVDNQGTFTLLDNADAAGGLINGTGIALFNNANAKLIIGEGSSEPETTGIGRVVSTTVPYVFGETYGVYTESGAEFTFFDGKIKGTNSVQGEVTETEYSYNATSNDVDGYEEVTLAQLVEPEARLNKSVYYGNIANAVSDARMGTSSMQNSNDSLLAGFKHVSPDDNVNTYYADNWEYPFVYDETTNTLISSSITYGSRSYTDTIIDLTDYQEDQVLELTYHVIPAADGRNGSVYLRVYELDENYIIGSSLSTIYTNGDIRAYRLEKNKRYKVCISFLQPVGIVKSEYVNESNGGYSLPSLDYIPYSQLIIEDGVLRTEERNSTNFEQISPYMRSYGFYYDSATNTLKSDHQYIKTGNSTESAYGSVELDLTNKVGDYVVSTTAYIETYDYSQATMYISEDEPQLTPYADSSANLMFLNTYSGTTSYDLEHYVGYDRPYAGLGPYNVSRTLTGGKKYYLNFSFFKNAKSDNPEQSEYEAHGVSDQMTITSIKVYKTGASEDLDFVHDSIGNAFDFEHPITQSNQVYYSLQHNNTDEYHDSYIKIDLTDSPVDKVLQVDSYMYPYNYLYLYVTSNNRGLSFDELERGRDKVLLYKDDIYTTGTINIASYSLSQYTHSSYNNSSENYYFKKGNVYYVHFNARLGAYNATSYKTDEYDCYNEKYGYCGSSLIKGMKLLSVEDTAFDYGNTPINVGTIEYDSLPEDTNTINDTSSDTIPVSSTFDTKYVWNEELNYYTLEKPLERYNAAGFNTSFDLTNETNPKTIQASYLWDSTGNLSWTDYYTIDEPAPMIYRNNGNFVVPADAVRFSIYGSPYITLEPGHKYYFYHMVYRPSGAATTDGVRYEEVDGTNTHEYTKGEKLVQFNEDVDEIQILRDIQLQNSMVIDYNKETVLDLNGYKISSSLTDDVIINRGKLTIEDSEYENQTSDTKVHNGKISSSAGNIIRNEKDAQLIIKDCVLEESSSSWNGRNAIYNNGKLFFDGSDTKIYVNERDAVGIYNYENGVINDDVSPLEIVMNYLGQAEQTYKVYSRNSSSRYTNINTGIYNYGYINVSNLKISGKNGTGFNNYSSNAIAVLRTANISVDINARDKVNVDGSNPYNYQYQYTSYSRTYINDIQDYSVKNVGTLTITQGSNIGNRTYSTNDLHITNGSRVGYLRTTGKSYITNGSTISDAEFKGNTIMEYAGISNRVDNYGDLQFKNSVGNVTSDFVFNNRGSGNVESYYATFYNINNYDSGTMFLDQGSAKHILNQGKSVTLNSFNVANNDTSYSEAIINSGTLNLGYKATVADSNDAAIRMVPKTITQSIEYYSVKVSKTTTTETTYYPTVLNIGTENDTESTNVITGKNHGITGNCYHRAERIENAAYMFVDRVYTSIDHLDRYYLSDFEGNREPLTQKNYDQTMCYVNMYSGTIKSTSNPNDVDKALNIPVSNTLEDSYTIFSNGLYVYPKQYAIDSNQTANVAKIGDTLYTSLKDAIDSVTTSDPVTIDLIFYSDVSKVEIPEGKNITLNFLGSKTNLYSDSGAFVNNGTLRLTGTGEVYSAGKYMVDNNGTLVIDSGTYSNLWDSNYKKESSIVNNKGTATINGGTFNQLDTYNTGNLTINDGIFNGSMLYGAGNSSVTTVKGGYFTNVDSTPTYLEYMVTTDRFNNNNGWRHLFELNDGALGVIDGLNTETDNRYSSFRPIAHVNNATLQLKSGKIANPTESYPVPYIVAENKSNVIVDDGEYDNVFIGIKGSHLQVNGGTLTSYADGNNANRLDLIYMYGITPTADITGGSLQSKENVIGLSRFKKDPDNEEETYAYKINIGIKGDRDNNGDIICSKTNPELIADKYPVTKYGTGSGTGTFGFYDGIFKGKSAALDISIDEIEEDYEVISETDGSYDVKYLDQLDLVKNNTTGIIYQTFQKAFREATNGDELETLRDYTNTTGTSKIVIPDTSNFTLKVKHLITINNIEFIENNGNVVFEGEGGSFNVPVSSNVFINNNNLTLNDVIINNLKATGAKPELIKNNTDAVLNINGSNIVTLQHHIINNYGTLNIDKTGTDSCYNTTRLIAEFQSGLNENPILIVNQASGIANITNMVMKSAYYNKLIDNSGQMIINNSVIDQTDTRGKSYEGYYEIDDDDNPGIIENTGSLEVDNSKIIFVPTTVNFIYGNTYNNYRYYERTFFKLYDGSSLTLKNNNIETYFMGLVAVVEANRNPIGTNITIESTTYHSQSFGIIANDNVNINLKYNIFNIRDSIIDGDRRYDFKNSSYNILTFKDPGVSGTTTHNSTIVIDGGIYNTEGYVKPLSGSYSANSMVYSTICENGVMDNNVTVGSVSQTDNYFSSTYTSPIVNIDNLTLKNTTINVNPPTSITGNGIYVCAYPSKAGEYRCDNSYSSNPVSSLSPNYVVKEIGAITNFGTANIINSTVSTAGVMSAISMYGNNAVVSIGEKDSLNSSKPVITSGTYNVPIKFYDEKGSLNLYDGSIESNSNILINHNSTDIDSHFADKEIDYNIASTSKTRYLSKEKIVKNITQDIEYDNYQSAFDEANNSDELKVLEGTTTLTTAEAATINGKTLSLDANCKNIGSIVNLTNGANLTVTSSTCESGDVSNIVKIEVFDTSRLTINDTVGSLVAHDNSIVTIKEKASYNVTAEDNSIINSLNKTDETYNIETANLSDNVVLNLTNSKARTLNLYGSSTFNNEDSFTNNAYLYDDSIYNGSCTDNSSTTINYLFNHSSQLLNLTCGTYDLENNGTAKIDGGVYYSSSNYGPLTITDGTFSTFIVGNSTANISGGTFTNLRVVPSKSYNDGVNVNITGGRFISQNASYNAALMINGLDTNNLVTNVNVSGGTFDHITGYDGYANLSITGGTIGAFINGSSKSINADITGGTFKYIKNNSASSTINIGAKDGIVSNTTPVINNDGSLTVDASIKSGINNIKGTINFYDGIVTGGTENGAIYGKINEVEDNYKIDVVDNGDGTETAYLTLITESDSKAAMVNGINYKSLQQAVNKSVQNCTSGSTCPNIYVYHNLEIDADLTIQEGYTVNIISNGFTISTNGFNVDPHITIDGHAFEDPSVGGDILNGIRGLLGIDDDKTSILVYEMSDGSQLDSESHYMLYKYDGTDYDLVTMEKSSEVARYNPGKGLTSMKPIKGRLYLINLEPGDYKVSDDNGREVTFTINNDRSISGHVKEYIPKDSNIDATGEAKLLISIQTGIRRINYMFIAISLIATLSILFVIKRRKDNKNLV